MAAISRAKVAAVLQVARRLIGTTREPVGKPDPELAKFISAIRVHEHVERVSKTSLDVTFKFDLDLLPRWLSDEERGDFKEGLVHDVSRRLDALGIEFGGHFVPVWGRGWLHGDVIFPVKAKSRKKVEQVMRAWKKGVRPAEGSRPDGAKEGPSRGG